MSTRKGIISILIGAFTSLIGTAFQFILMYLLIRSYGSQLNGFVKNSIAIVSFLGTVEGGLGAITVIFLIKPLLQKDWIKANEMVNTAKHQYKISGIIGVILLAAIALGYSAYTFLFENNFSILLNDQTIIYPLWKMVLIILIIGSKNLIALFWTACYENLMQADQNNHIRRLILMICDLVSYSIIFYLISQTVDPLFVFLIFLGYSIMKGSLIVIFVKLHYPWIRIVRHKDNMQLVKSSNIVVLKNIGETLLINGHVIITALLLGLRISSTLSLYMTITVGVRSIMMILINSFREFFAAWTAKNGRIDWNSYIKFETYAFMIGAFLFVNQFILSPYFVTTLYAPQIIEQINNSATTINPWTPQEIAIFKNIFYHPTFSLLVALSSVFIVLAEPANVLVYAKANYKQTAVPTFVIGLINFVLCLFTALIFRFLVNDLAGALYGILIVTCFISALRFLYLWFYNWLFLTYNSNFKGVFRNWMILLIPIVIAILVNYLFLTKTYNPVQIYNDQLDPIWGWQKLLNMFFGLIFGSLFVIIVNSILWAPHSVWGIFLRLPIVQRIWTKRQDKMRQIREKKYEDDFITLTEPEMPYQKLWEREEALQQNTKKMGEDEPFKEIYKLKG
ncbi:transporter [Spiroplasma endosymbiont of Stenodema calcarata]|uniref:transporter n=1 Tax=Spiroplasma endosymbiont of Stenodema calcarata TaxID=3139328 RepID=UPI003CCAFED9